MAYNSRLTQRAGSAATALFFSVVLAAGAQASFLVPQTPLLGRTIPKYVDPLPTFVGSRVPAGSGYTVSHEEFRQMVLPASIYAPLAPPYNAGTLVWGYKITDGGNNVHGPLWPGFTVEAQRGTPVTVEYLNNLINPQLQSYVSVDQTIHWADPLQLFCSFREVDCLVTPTDPCCQPYSGPVPVGPHLHGAEVKSDFDGGPDQWFTQSGLHGGAFRSDPAAGAPPANGAFYTYPNGQEAATLWFHDHSLGTTRTNVYSGLAAFYFLRDGRDTGLANNPINLPAGNQEVEIVIQDRQFDTNGQLLFPDGEPEGENGSPPNPDLHPFWNPEFFGDVITVNGKSWPYLNVEPRRYRFRMLNGSNARMYDLAIVGGKNKKVAGPPIWQIGTDGGLLDAPVRIAWPKRLFMAPGERADVIVDFSPFAGQTLTIVNDAKAPFPGGAPADRDTVGQIMQFRVGTTVTGTDTSCNPALANSCVLRAAPIVRLVNPATGTIAPGVTPVIKRQLVLKEIEETGGPAEVLINNTKFSGLKESTMMTATPSKVAGSFASTYTVPKPAGVAGDAGLNWITEGPEVGSTEVWEIANITADAHPIHIHLVQFQLMNRQPIQANKYTRDWMAAFPGGIYVPGDGPPQPYNVLNSDGALGGNPALTPYLYGVPSSPNPNEAGWKDTIVMLPGTVTRIVARWTPQNTTVGSETLGSSLFPFDPTDGPGYVWHCHILDHEDNEMMRPYRVLSTLQAKAITAGPLVASTAAEQNGKTAGTMNFIVVKLDGKTQTYDCPACALESVDPTTIRSAMATDFFTKKRISAELAFYVEGTKVGECCKNRLVAFEKKEYAEKFAKAFGGRVLTYQQALTALSGKRKPLVSGVVSGAS